MRVSQVRLLSGVHRGKGKEMIRITLGIIIIGVIIYAIITPGVPFHSFLDPPEPAMMNVVGQVAGGLAIAYLLVFWRRKGD
jgi:hypothetical protein